MYDNSDVSIYVSVRVYCSADQLGTLLAAVYVAVKTSSSFFRIVLARSCHVVFS